MSASNASLHFLDTLQRGNLDYSDLCVTAPGNPFYHSYTTVLVSLIPARVRQHIHSLFSLCDVVQLASVHPAEPTNWNNNKKNIFGATFPSMNDEEWLTRGLHCPICLPRGLESVDEDVAGTLLRVELRVALEKHDHMSLEN